jgi:hypothetical protein
MDWQETTALAITAGTAVAFVWARLRRRKFSFQRDTHCGCNAASSPAPVGGSITFHARKGERPQVIVRTK